MKKKRNAKPLARPSMKKSSDSRMKRLKKGGREMKS